MFAPTRASTNYGQPHLEAWTPSLHSRAATNWIAVSTCCVLAASSFTRTELSRCRDRGREFGSEDSTPFQVRGSSGD